MVGMAVVQDPGVLGDLGTVVNLQKSAVPRGLPLEWCVRLVNLLIWVSLSLDDPEKGKK